MAYLKAFVKESSKLITKGAELAVSGVDLAVKRASVAVDTDTYNRNHVRNIISTINPKQKKVLKTLRKLRDNKEIEVDLKLYLKLVMNHCPNTYAHTLSQIGKGLFNYATSDATQTLIAMVDKAESPHDKAECILNYMMEQDKWVHQFCCDLWDNYPDLFVHKKPIAGLRENDNNSVVEGHVVDQQITSPDNNVDQITGLKRNSIFNHDERPAKKPSLTNKGLEGLKPEDPQKNDGENNTQPSR